MKRVEVTKAFRWAPDGIHAREVEIGEVLEGEGAEIALQMGCGQELQTKAFPAAPKNKGR